MNPLLAVCVPTINRADFLDFFLETHVPIMREHDIPIYISDNASTDATQAIVTKWQNEYPYIFCTRQSEVCNSDENAINALGMSKEKYAWLMGDTYEITKESLGSTLAELDDEEYDIVIVNLTNKITAYKNKTYTDCNEFIREVAWISTCVSCNIYSRDLIDNGQHGKYSSTNFGQLGFILSHIAHKDFRLRWLQDVSVVTLKTPVRKDEGWNQIFLDVIFRDWQNFIKILPEVYTAENRKKLQDALYVEGAMFNPRRLLHLRAKNIINSENLQLYSKEFDQLPDPNTLKLAKVLNQIPVRICHVLVQMIEWIRRRNYRIRNALGLWPSNR